MIDHDQKLELARAFGFAGDARDLEGRVVECQTPHEGIVTSEQAEDWGNMSVIVAHNATAISYSGKWNSETLGHATSRFSVDSGATFVATEWDGKPQRVFLYINAPGFDVVKIIKALQKHRAGNPLPRQLLMTG